MNDIAILDNPYIDGGIVQSRGVLVDSKAAKLNNMTKRPVLVNNWEEKRPDANINQTVNVSAPKNYDEIINKVGIVSVNYAKEANNNGAKKLRVNKIVTVKTSDVYNNSSKQDVIVEQEVKPVVEEKTVIETPSPIPMEPVVSSSRADIHGRHERTGEIPVEAIREAVKNDNPMISNPAVSRVERNSMVDTRMETKALDMDAYNKLMHGTEEEDVSRQLQGAKKELSMEKEESRKLAEQYGEAVKELEKLKADIESKKKMKEQQDKQELSATLNDLETLKRENLERTSDLSSIQAEIARLKAEKRAMEDNFYDDYRSYGRAA